MRRVATQMDALNKLASAAPPMPKDGVAMTTRSKSGALSSSSGRSVIVGTRYSAPTRVARS